MNKKYFLAYSICALGISNFHFHYILVDAWKQRIKEAGKNCIEQEKSNCYWLRTIERIMP